MHVDGIDIGEGERNVSFSYFEGEIQQNGKNIIVQATTDDTIEDIVQKALDIDFYGELPIYAEENMQRKQVLPKRYITFGRNYELFSYANNEPILSTVNYDITIISKRKADIQLYIDRIRNCMWKKGFALSNAGSFLERDPESDYYGYTQTFSFVLAVCSDG